MKPLCKPGGILTFRTVSERELHCWTHLSYVPESHIYQLYDEYVHNRRPCSQSSTNSETGDIPVPREEKEGSPTVKRVGRGRALKARRRPLLLKTRQ